MHTFYTQHIRTTEVYGPLSYWSLNQEISSYEVSDNMLA